MTLGSFDVYVDNDNTFTLPALINNVTNAVETGATVTLSIVDANGADVPGITFPKTMPNINSAGDYQVTIDKDLQLTVGLRYRALIIATDGSGGDAAWDIPFVAQQRSS